MIGFVLLVSPCNWRFVFGFFPLLVFLWLGSISAQGMAGVAARSSVAIAGGLVDSEAEPETRALFFNLRRLASEKVLFGHQDTTAYGIDWEGDDDRSDVKTLCGSYPAVYGWDYGRIERDPSGEAEALIRRRMEEAFRRGGVNTMSWHMSNPVTGGSFYDTTKAVHVLLPGGTGHLAYQKRLDQLAAFFKSLKGRDGRHVPVIFRPFHEHTGGWFWWGQKHCSREEYIALWRFTVEYLRDQCGVHSLLYAYSPSKNDGDEAIYLDRYPGDGFVDVLGQDRYSQTAKDALKELRLGVRLAAERGKISAFTEVGVPKGISRSTNKKYYTTQLLEPIKSDPEARKIAYFLVWRNSNREHFWVPYPGHPEAEDFKAFCEDSFTLLEDDLPDLYTNQE